MQKVSFNLTFASSDIKRKFEMKRNFISRKENNLFQMFKFMKQKWFEKI